MIIPEKNRGKAYQILFALLEWLFVFAIVMDCNSVYANLVDSLFNLQKIALVLGAFLLLCLFLELQMKFLDLIKLAIIPAVCVFFYAGCLLAVMPVEPGYLGSYIKFFMLFLPLCIVLFQLYEKRGRHFALFYRVSDITLILAVLSLVMWTLTVVLDVLEPTGAIATRWGDIPPLDTFWGLHFHRDVQSEIVFGHKILRNIGLFPESPMYDIILVTSFYTDLFLRERPRIGRAFLLFVTIVTTFGTLAIMLSLLGTFLYICSLIKAKWRWLVFGGLGILLAAGIAALLVNKMRTGTGSYNTHLDDFAACIKAWLQYPWFGSGFENYRVIHEHMSESRLHNLGITTSLGAVLAQGGVGLAVVYLAPYVALLRNVFRKDGFKVILWGIGTLGLIVVSIFQYRFFMFLLLALGYSYMPNLLTIQEKMREKKKTSD